MYLMLNLNGATSFLEETPSANPYMSSQLSASSAASTLSYFDSPRAQPLSQGISSSPLQSRKQGVPVSSPVPLSGSLWNNVFLHRQSPKALRTSSPYKQTPPAVSVQSPFPSPAKACSVNCERNSPSDQPPALSPSHLHTVKVPASTVQLASEEEEILALQLVAEQELVIDPIVVNCKFQMHECILICIAVFPIRGFDLPIIYQNFNLIAGLHKSFWCLGS